MATDQRRSSGMQRPLGSDGVRGMTDDKESFVDRIVTRLPIDPRLARLTMEATIEEIHRLMWIEDDTVEAARHVFRNLSPEACAHLLSILQCALGETASGLDENLYEEASQRLSTGRVLMQAKVREWLEEQPESRKQIDAARRSGRGRLTITK